jgi:PAS domain S-box-containing protein
LIGNSHRARPEICGLPITGIAAQSGLLMKAVLKKERRVAYPLVVVFVLLVAGIVTAGCLYYRNYKQQFRAAAEHQLTAIAELKASDLAQYRKERLEDASIFFNNTAFSGLVRRFFNHPEDTDAQRQIQEWMVKCSATDQYNLSCLLDAQGITRLSSSAGPPSVSSAVMQRIPEILRAGQATFQDFHRNEHDQRIYLDILIPILDEQDASRPLGVFYLRIDPEKYLYPYIQRWPVSSETAETLLVRRDSNNALFLNKLRFQTNSALNLRIPLTNTNMPAVKAVLGQTGIVEGVDYRGEPVLAALRAVPNSPWFLIARMDTAEVFAPMRARLWQVVVIICALLFGSAAFVGLVWRHQRARFYQAKYEAEEARTKLSAIIESSEDAIMSKSLDGIITSWNTGAEHIYGYSAAEAIGKPITILIPPDRPNELPRLIEEIKRGEAIKHYETERIRKNGERIQMSLSLSPIKDETGAIVGISAIGRDITERRRAEEALRFRNILLSTQQEASIDGILVVDENGKIISSNRRFADMWGISDDIMASGSDKRALQSVGDKLANPEEFLNKVKHLYKARNETSRDEIALKDGRTFDRYSAPMFGPDKRYYGRVWYFRDLTERKQAEKALREEQTLSATLMDNLPDAIYFKDAASRFLRVNHTHSHKFNLSEPAQLIGKSDADFFSSEHARKALADEQEIIRTGQPLLNIEEKEIWPDGTVTWALTTKLPLHDETGHVIGTCGISRNITERKRVEEKLRQLSLAVEQSPASIVITNPAGDIEYVNSKFVDITGYTLAEALGKNPRILKSGEKGPEAYRELWETITAGKEWRGEFHNKKKNGELYWESASISPIRDSAGHITHFLAVKEDITARKLTEAERDQLIRELKDALARVKSLSGLLPICANCKKIRDDKGYWSQVESYIQQHSEATFSHGLCPDYIKKLYPDLAKEGGLGDSPKKAP